MILNDITWQTYNNTLTELGENSSVHLAYCEGNLEIKQLSGEEENTNRFIDDLIRILADELNLNLKKFGSLTLKRENLLKSAEPDSCYYIKNELLVRGKRDIDLNFDPSPDLVLETDITNSSLDKHPIYAALGVPEFWRYNGKKLEFLVLSKPTLTYNPVSQSPTFPFLTTDIIPQLLERSLTEGETATLRYFRTWLKQHLANN
ncbi:MAG TPA: Uma2 family endonuclease [Nostocaceae cyanobacterium]|nr:Uma2 family endonuclease [Nostocaceae cyanobacterium]